jgi:hypothetical protein
VYSSDGSATGGDAEGEDNSNAPDVSKYDFGDVHRFRIARSEGSEGTAATGDDVPALHRDEVSVESPSMASWASTSTNPFRRHMKNHLKEHVHLGTEPRFMERSIWDDPILHQ